MANPARIRDVLILGGGPAGCAAAIHSAQLGLRVALIEAKTFPRHRPGETLHPGIEPILRQLGVFDQVVSAGLVRHEGNGVERDGPPRLAAYGQDAGVPWRGFRAWREVLDALLLERAKELGVEVHLNCRAGEVAYHQHRVAGVRTNFGMMHAAFVVDAGGGGHWLARQLGLTITHYSPRLIARYGYVRGSYLAPDTAPLISSDASGWTWIARVEADCYQWTRLSLRAHRYPANWRPAELGSLTPEGPLRSADVTWRKVDSVAGPGFFLAGDAGATLDPASSHGVLKGLTSGMMSAHLIAAVQRGKETPERAMIAYRQWFDGWFAAEVARLRELYLARWPDFGVRDAETRKALNRRSERLRNVLARFGAA